MAILGIDVGGTGMKGALVDTETGELLSERFRLDTPKKGIQKAWHNALMKSLNTLTIRGLLVPDFQRS